MNNYYNKSKAVEHIDLQSPHHFTDQFKVLAENATSLIFVAQKGRIVYANPAFATITGYSCDELCQMERGWEIVDLEYQHLIKKRYLARESGEEVPRNYEIKLICKNGEEKWIDYSGAVIEHLGKPAILGSGIDLTQRKRAEESYRESELLYRTIFETSGTAMMIFGEDMLISLVNHEFEKLSGYSKAEIENIKKWPEFIADKDLARMKEYHLKRRIDPNSAPSNYEFQLINRSGNTRDIYITVNLIPGTKDSVVSFMDISKRKQMELSLKESEARWQFALESSNEGVWDWDLDTNVVFYSPRWKAMLGYEGHEIGNTLEEWDKRVHPDDKDKCYEKIKKCLRGETALYKSEHRILCKDSSYRWVLDRGKIVECSPEGRPLRMIGTHADITERKQMEAEREDLLSLLQAMFNEHTAVMLLIDPVSGRISDANPAACTFYGYNRAELLNMSIQEINLLPKEEVERLRLKALEQKQMYFFFPHRLKSGEIRLVDVYSCPVSHNRETRLFSIIFDVTDRERYREELYWEKELLRATLLSIGDGVFTTDGQGRITSINNVAEHLTGWQQEEALGKFLDEIFVIVDELSGKHLNNPAFKVLETGHIFDLTENVMLLSQEGIVRPIEATAAPIKGEDAQIKGVILTFRDFSEKKERQERIEFLSYHDQLTGLYNRRFFEEELRRLDTKRNLPLTLVMGDINGLKLTNDAFGHLAGDRLLRRVAAVIKHNCRADDIIARVGGDEFIILLPKTEADEAQKMVKRINESLLYDNSSNIPLSISFGWATKYSTDERTAKVFKKAEDAMYRRKLSESASMRNETVKVIVKALYEKNEREQAHSARVSTLCQALGMALELSVEDINELKTVGLMHDIGKIILDDRILDKPGSLSDDEFVEVKRHAETGYRILSSVNEFAPLAEYVLAHHERWDGKGYPKGLKGNDIPLHSRIIAIADAYDAITSDRPYRTAMNEAYAREEIRRNSGTQFDPHITTVFLKEVLK